MDDSQRSLEFMRNPMKWPNFALPVKRPSNPQGGVQLGAMFDERPRVYLVNVWDLSRFKGTPLDEIPHEDYLDLEGVVDAGWRVD